MTCKDTGNCDTFASYSSGYLSQDSFVDLTKQDNQLPDCHADALRYSASNTDPQNDGPRNSNTFQKSTMDNASSKRFDNKEIMRSSNEEELGQEVILPDSLSNEDEPMVLITKPCLPPGPKSKENCTKATLSSSKTVTDLMHHLSLKRDKRKDFSQTGKDKKSGSDGFAHLDWKINVPYNLSDEPDDCKGMKYSHSCQSMPSASEEKPLKKNSSNLTGNELNCNNKLQDDEKQEDPMSMISDKNDSKEVKTVNELLLETMDSKEDNLRYDEETTDGKVKKVENFMRTDLTQEVKSTSDSSNSQNMHKKNSIVDVKKDIDVDKSLAVETLQQKRNREQKILSQKLDEFRKNSRSTKADHIKTCTDRQIRAKSEDIIIKPFLGNSKKYGDKDSSKDPEKLFSKRHSSVLSQNSRESNIDKTSFKQEKSKKPPLDELEKTRRRLASDSDICYNEKDKGPGDSGNGAKTKNLSLMELGKSSKGNDMVSKNSKTHKLSAPHLVKSLDSNSGAKQEKEVKLEKNVDDLGSC